MERETVEENYVWRASDRGMVPDRPGLCVCDADMTVWQKGERIGIDATIALGRHFAWAVEFTPVPECPVCESRAEVQVQTPDEGRPYSCDNCGLEFFATTAATDAA